MIFFLAEPGTWITGSRYFSNMSHCVRSAANSGSQGKETHIVHSWKKRLTRQPPAAKACRRQNSTTQNPPQNQSLLREVRLQEKRFIPVSVAKPKKPPSASWSKRMARRSPLLTHKNPLAAALRNIAQHAVQQGTSRVQFALFTDRTWLKRTRPCNRRHCYLLRLLA